MTRLATIASLTLPPAFPLTPHSHTYSPYTHHSARLVIVAGPARFPF